MNEYAQVTGPPLHVQLARISHSLETVHLLLRQDDYVAANEELREAKDLVARLQRSAK